MGRVYSFQKNSRRPMGSIQKRILLITTSCLLGMCIIISSVIFYLFRNYMKNSLIIST